MQLRGQKSVKSPLNFFMFKLFKQNNFTKNTFDHLKIYNIAKQIQQKFNIIFSTMSFSQQPWQSSTALNPLIIKSLYKAGFEKPTKIQAEVLQQFKHYYDFLIASQTGSGKTLAFALPILSDLLDFHKNSALEKLPSALLGLIITPTRELAQQIQQNVRQILDNIECQISVISIIGGMSKQKQLRIIRQRKPHIIIGTPGRIYEFLEDQVFNFEHLKYLVIDQADRMIQLGHYVEVDQILQKIFRPKVKQFYEKDFLEITESIAKKDKLKNKKEQGLFIKQNGKKVRINFDLHSIESDKLFEVPAELFQFVDAGNKPIEVENPVQTKLVEAQEEHNLFKELTEQQVFWLNRLKRRIFFVSATLTRQFKGQKYSFKKKRNQEEDLSKDKKNKKKDKNIKKGNEEKKQGQENDIENIPKLKALLSRVNFSTKPKIIDQSSELFLPEGLKEKISFTDGQIERISMLICYLKSLSPQSKTIIFANTIKVSRRIQFFLSSLDYKCTALHSHMEQKQRLTKLQRFKKSQFINILISTDVAARGLDFFVSNVVQYGVPINGDTYVHRSGRTARANRSGEALIIVDRTQGGKWGEINDVLNESVKERKVEKYVPGKMIMDEVEEKVKQLQWIRVNNQRQADLRNQKLEQMQAEDMGVEREEEEKRKKYDLDKQQEQMVRHELKKKVQKIKKNTFSNSRVLPQNNIKWKKNKLILSPDEIMKMI